MDYTLLPNVDHAHKCAECGQVPEVQRLDYGVWLVYCLTCGVQLEDMDLIRALVAWNEYNPETQPIKVNWQITE